MFGALFSFRSIVDVLLIATVIYQVYRWLSQTRAVQLIKGVLWVGVLYGIALVLSLDTLLWIMNSFAPSLLIAMAIIFQPEIRQIMNRLGKQRIIPFYFGSSDAHKQRSIAEVVAACKKLVEMQRGALLVFTQLVKLRTITDNGIAINSDISEELITTIFGHNTVLHDGAVIIENGKIVAAKCVLPLAVRSKATERYGTRHRAGIEITEESDAVAVIVSEESGRVSVARDGKLQEGMSFVALHRYLAQILINEQVGAVENDDAMVSDGSINDGAVRGRSVHNQQTLSTATTLNVAKKGGVAANSTSATARRARQGTPVATRGERAATRRDRQDVHVAANRIQRATANRSTVDTSPLPSRHRHAGGAAKK